MRLEKVDILRGIAIIMMIIFHLNYSLVHIFSSDILNFSEMFWFYEGRISALLFIYIGGVSFYLAEKKYGKNIIKKYLKVSVFLGIMATGISLATYLFLPEQYIRFGIIHFFSLAFFLLLIFRKLKYLNIGVGIFIIIYGFYFIPVVENKYFYFLGFTYPGFQSADFYPIFPYFGVILLGYISGKLLSDFNKINILSIKSKGNSVYNVLGYFGRKSLIIYVIHQPIIVLILKLI